MEFRERHSKISRAEQSKVVKNASKLVDIQKTASIESGLIDKEINDEYLNSTYADGLSGIIFEGNRKTMPEYIEKLAEDEKAILNEEEPVTELINIEFDDEPLTRAEELSSDESRMIEGLGTEKPSTEQIQKETEVMLAEGHDLQDIAQDLKKKFPEKTVNKFLETHRSELMQKYGQLGYIYLDKRLYDSCEDIRTAVRRLSTRNLLTKLKESETAKVKCRDCTRYKNGYCLLTNLKVANVPEITTDREAKFVINKFASIDISIRDQYIERLVKDNPAKVVSEFLASIERLRRESARLDTDNKVGFKRDIDEKVLKERLIENNSEKNAVLKEKFVNHTILQDLKSYIQSGLDIKTAHKRLLDVYSPLQLEKLYSKYASEIDQFVKFYNRNKEPQIERFDNQGSKKDVITAKNSTVKEKDLFRKMMNHADLMLSEGKEPIEVQSSLKKTFGIEQTIKFMNEHERILNKHYGQLGYNYVDSNLYKNCDEMAKVVSGFTHISKNLLYNVKANEKCKECNFNQHGRCKKVELMVSNNPIVMSPRAALKLFKRAEELIPKDHIEKFNKKVSNFGNAKIVSAFNLSLKAFLRDDNMTKTAAANDEIQNGMKQVNTYNVDIFKSSSVSKIADEVLKGE